MQCTVIPILKIHDIKESPLRWSLLLLHNYLLILGSFNACSLFLYGQAHLLTHYNPAMGCNQREGYGCGEKN